MAMDLETNGIHNGTNGVDHDASAHSEPTTNGNHRTVDSAAAVDNMVNLSSGLGAVGEVVGSQHDNNSLFGSDAGVTSALDAVEAPTSDVRDEPLQPMETTTQTSSESTQKVPETQLESAEVVPEKKSQSQEVTDPIKREADPTPPPTKNMTDLSLETQQAAAAHTPAATVDHEMEDAPASGKVRPREDDTEEGLDDERGAKRVKTEMDIDIDTKTEAKPSTEADQPNSAAPAPAALPTPTSTQGGSVVQTAVGYKDWPSTPMTEGQRKFLLERIRNTKKIKVSLAFKDPVDPVALNIPTYHDFVKKPMDLTTIETKLKEAKYPKIVDFMEDLDQIITNSELFNSSSHPITQNGYNMRAYFLKGTDRLPREGEEPPKTSKHTKKPSATAAPSKPPRRESRVAPHNAKSPTAPTPTATSPGTAWPLQDGVPLIRRESTSLDGRPKREIHRPPSKDLPYSKPRKKKYQHELKFCESVLAELMKAKYAKFSYPFMTPVDPVALNIPSYLKIIKKPMDFGTIEKQLREGQYQSAKEFHNDCLLVFNNCFKFNPEGDEVNKMGKQLNELFNNLWSEKSEWLSQHAPEAAPQSPGSSEDEEEEEEEEEADPAQAQFLAIQKQIQQLNETAQQLLQQQNQRKAASPKAGGKKKAATKPQTHKKAKSTQLSVPPPPKAAKSKARTKPLPPLTYTQKQEISDGISTLGDADMRRAVQIIRSGCPNLANTNDDEMELDMDEINDDTLRNLLKFIKSVRGPKAAVADDDYDPPRPTYKAAAASRPKKNKPMGKTEQEDSLRRIQEKMQSFNGAASGSSQSPPANQEESSEDESSASESEEE